MERPWANQSDTNPTTYNPTSGGGVNNIIYTAKTYMYTHKIEAIGRGSKPAK